MLRFSGSRGPHRPDLPSPFGRKFQLSVGGESRRIRAPHWSPSRHRMYNRGPRCFFLGKRDWSRWRNQVIPTLTFNAPLERRLHKTQSDLEIPPRQWTLELKRQDTSHRTRSIGTVLTEMNAVWLFCFPPQN